jgi:cysteine desulfurase
MTGTHPQLPDGPAYLDYNATTPVHPRVIDAMWPYLVEHFGTRPAATPTAARRPPRLVRPAPGWPS